MGYNTNYNNYNPRANAPYAQGGNFPYAQGPYNDPNGEPTEYASRSYNKRPYSRSNRSNDQLEFQIVRCIGVLQENAYTNWRRELNVVCWNNKAPKYDLRDWSPDHSKMSKGICFSLEETVRLYEILHNEVMLIQSETMTNNLSAGTTAAAPAMTMPTQATPTVNAVMQPMAPVNQVAPMNQAAPTMPWAGTTPAKAPTVAPQATPSALDQLAPINPNSPLVTPTNNATNLPNPNGVNSMMTTASFPASTPTPVNEAMPPFSGNGTTLNSEQTPPMSQSLDNAVALMPESTAIAEPAFGANSFAANALQNNSLQGTANLTETSQPEQPQSKAMAPQADTTLTKDQPETTIAPEPLLTPPF